MVHVRGPGRRTSPGRRPGVPVRPGAVRSRLRSLVPSYLIEAYKRGERIERNGSILDPGLMVELEVRPGRQLNIEYDGPGSLTEALEGISQEADRVPREISGPRRPAHRTDSPRPHPAVMDAQARTDASPDRPGPRRGGGEEPRGSPAGMEAEPGRVEAAVRSAHSSSTRSTRSTESLLTQQKARFDADQAQVEKLEAQLPRRNNGSSRPRPRSSRRRRSHGQSGAACRAPSGAADVPDKNRRMTSRWSGQTRRVKKAQGPSSTLASRSSSR